MILLGILSGSVLIVLLVNVIGTIWIMWGYPLDRQAYAYKMLFGIKYIGFLTDFFFNKLWNNHSFAPLILNQVWHFLVISSILSSIVSIPTIILAQMHLDITLFNF